PGRGFERGQTPGRGFARGQTPGRGFALGQTPGRGFRAKLQGADLSVAELQGALFWGASLGGARLVDVDLRAAYLWGIDFKKFTPDEWTKLKDEIAAAVPAGEMRKNALENIYKAMKSETDIRPKSAEGAIYDPSVPELADQLKQWPPLDEDAYWPFELRLGILTGIACDDNKYTAVGIARRARRTEPFDDPHLAGALLEQECLAIQVLPENLKAKLREAAEGPDKP
ncbi:MAG TPA: pentapeptide repeat-containing protein, partial [Rhodospirillaceae bacterium]|nr:pentapeptide repeat-containing protein [Rhodospirillaceae bacterium]